MTAEILYNKIRQRLIESGIPELDLEPFEEMSKDEDQLIATNIFLEIYNEGRQELLKEIIGEIEEKKIKHKSIDTSEVKLANGFNLAIEDILDILTQKLKLKEVDNGK